MTYEIVELRLAQAEGLDRVSVYVDPNKLHPTWLARVIEYGCRRLPNDDSSSLKGQVKIDAIKLFVAEMESGNPLEAKERKAGVSKADPVRKLARDVAADMIAAQCKKKFGKDAELWIADKVWARYLKRTDGGKVAFDLVGLDFFIAQMKNAHKFGKVGARDFMAEAEETLAKAIDVELDLEALGL